MTTSNTASPHFAVMKVGLPKPERLPGCPCDLPWLHFKGCPHWHDPGFYGAKAFKR